MLLHSNVAHVFGFKILHPYQVQYCSLPLNKITLFPKLHMGYSSSSVIALVHDFTFLHNFFSFHPVMYSGGERHDCFHFRKHSSSWHLFKNERTMYTCKSDTLFAYKTFVCVYCQTIQTLLRDVASLEAEKFRNQPNRPSYFIYHRYIPDYNNNCTQLIS